MSGLNSTDTNGRSMESRVGRSKQLYNSKGFRRVAGVVPLSPDKERVLLIRSKPTESKLTESTGSTESTKGWVLPKGGWESDETCQQAAVREAWEEAGIEVEVEASPDIIEEQHCRKLSKGQSEYNFFQGTVLERHDKWPEHEKREREWFTISQAMEILKTRPELQEALKSSILSHAVEALTPQPERQEALKSAIAARKSSIAALNDSLAAGKSSTAALKNGPEPQEALECSIEALQASITALKSSIFSQAIEALKNRPDLQVLLKEFQN
ncbi:NUDIX hydrolase domain protein [Cordyceps fumosorosea ARSEF 2679]|uniref:NUDIX hydrolase domain protein n=1 Tax=Cordyceps fumosorosea (strain ARSEF 2679) TaxID=1081104 RepID=A0A162I9E0_CORFA|nr:NUDIX hydrolase domain protein [Cordyceps fumosorosea ARSEF 2679]OAA54035.1 NUDIX hydrolase domain protein [Cordyceps fumosorosea ARSEF 2679]